MTGDPAGLLVIACIVVAAPVCAGGLAPLLVPVPVVELIAGVLVGPTNLLHVPLPLLALLTTRGVAALLYVWAIGAHRTLTAALLQSTSLPFLVTAGAIGVALHTVTPATAAALVATGVASATILPNLAAVTLARRRSRDADQ